MNLDRYPASNIIFLIEKVHLDNRSLALKLTDSDFRCIEIVTLVVSTVKITPSKSGVAHSRDVRDLRWGELLVWGVPVLS